MATIFSKIVNGEIPAHKIAETDDYYAFLDIFPIKHGHTLVIPRVETDQFFDLDDETMAGLMVFAKRVAKAIKKTFPCNRVGMSVIGLEVPHAHIHLIPINVLRDISFINQPKTPMSNLELAEIAKRIKANFE
jgi:histidine triad (HIT) family protein